MIRDYDKKMEVVLDFYEQAQEILSMVHDDIKGFHYLYGFDLMSEEISDHAKNSYIIDIEKKVAARKKQLLIQLGRVGEYAIKYILLLEQMRLVPDQTYEEFMNNTLYTLGEKNPTQRNSTSGFYVNNNHISMDVFDDIKSEKDNHKKQPLHDYAYLFFILKRMFPEVVEDMHKVMNYHIKSNRALDSELPDFLKEDLYIFPQRDVVEFNGMTDEEQELCRSEFERVLNESGDIFIRLRYIENNPNNREYSLEDILNIMDYLFDYVRLTHDMEHDNISNNITATYNKEKCIEARIRYIGKNISVDERKDALNKEVERIDRIFAIERIAFNPDLILASIFYSKLSVEEIEELINNTELSDNDLYPLIYNNISFSLYGRLCDKGISDIGHICKLSINDNIEELLNLSYEELCLMKWLDVDTLNKLRNIPEVYSFCLDNPEVVGNFFGAMYFDDKAADLFIELVSMEEIRNNPILIYGLDRNQIRVFSSLAYGISDEEIKSNISGNVKYFRDNPDLYKVVPFMLDGENAKKILDLLSTQGLDMNKLDKLDTTIFCLPFSLVLEITNFLNSKGMYIIQGENDLKVFFSFVEENRKYLYRKEGKAGIPLPLQHRKNYVSDIGDSGYNKKIN